MTDNCTINICFIGLSTYPLFFPNKFQSPPKFTGIDVKIFTLVSKLCQNRHYRLTLLTGDFGQKNETVDRIRFLKTYRPTTNNLISGVKNFFILIKNIYQEKPHIIVSSGYSWPLNLELFLLPIISKNTKHLHLVSSDSDLTKKGIHNLIYKYFLKNSDFVVVQNSFQEKHLIALNHNVAKIYNSISKLPASTKNKKGYILWCGSSNPIKNPILFARICQKIKYPVNFIIQNYSDDVLVKIKQIINKQPHVKLIENVPFSQINSYFLKAKILVNTSTQEGFPNTFVQAIVNQIPVVSLNADPDHIIQDNFLGYCCHNNSRLLATNITALINNKQLYRQVTNNCAKISNLFDINKNIIKFNKILFYLNNT